ncbi:fumarylacetoacetate hydrolase family protein [Streptomyces sp. NBC_01239]|uniref:2-keto-4-pentenoate hydratase n=1 Tax=Streptomyces sp. NBC_01239 TaxID=2903792 RepID=UPI00224D74D9|nr:fumarylacetoacetate hydrolase family protein [Streptomyces sp. NBC_01239]MCX4815217.1 fumarylacetoacetate hydrolase family protein [Streptomyces sp. NBC_01239]
MTTDMEAVRRAADRLERASVTGKACEPITDLIGAGDIETAYRVQQSVTEGRLAAGARLIGRKIGLTSEAVQSQVGVDRPDFGVLFDDMRYADGELIVYERLLQPKAEAEVAFLLGRDLADEGDLAAVREAVELAYPAVEIVDSRITDWRIGITDTVADNASSGVFVIGDRGVPLNAFEPSETVMTMRRGGQVVSSGTGRDCLGDPLNALTWLAATAIEFGSPLRAGDVVLSGALGPMVPAFPGDVFEVTIEPLGTITARFSEKGE